MRAGSIDAIQLIIPVTVFSLVPNPTLSVMSIAMSLFFFSLHISNICCSEVHDVAGVYESTGLGAV
jgi:hypothetical protein